MIMEQTLEHGGASSGAFWRNWGALSREPGTWHFLEWQRSYLSVAPRHSSSVLTADGTTEIVITGRSLSRVLPGRRTARSRIFSLATCVRRLCRRAILCGLAKGYS